MMLTEKDTKKVSKALSGVASKWRWIGLSLGLPQYTLENIDQSHQTADQKMVGMVRKWLTSAGKEASWQKLVDVLRSGILNEKRLAHDLELKHCSGAAASASASSSGSSSGGSGKQSANGEFVE